MKPERISTKVVIPVSLVVILSLTIGFLLLANHSKEIVVKLNTAALQLETKRLYHVCEKAVEELISDQQFGNPEAMATKKEVALSEIETHLLAEGVDGLLTSQNKMIFSTVEIEPNFEFKGASGIIRVRGGEGAFYGYYLYFPIWEWYLVTLLHEDFYWASHRRIKQFLGFTGMIYIILGTSVLLILFYGVQRPLHLMVNQLTSEGKITYISGTRELDLFASTINTQLALIVKENRAKIERKKIEHELEIARNIQQSFLPQRMHAPENIDIAAISIPAMRVGGDFYDFIPLEESNYGLVVADVSDKGIPAALLMALSRALIRVIATQEQAITDVVERMNVLLQEFATAGYFVTLFYAIINTEHNAMEYVRAGHNPPIVYRAENDEFLSLSGKGMALGAVRDIKIEANRFDMLKDDILVLYTDGVTDAINPNGVPFGTERLYSVLRTNRDESSQVILESLRYEIEKFAASTPQYDDITVMIVKV